jgi:N-acylneuraminate cytidylyltransferase
LVSTEDSEIADVAREAGAEVPFMRPIILAGDTVLDLPVFKHVLDTLMERESYSPDLVVHLRPTTPLRKDGWIDDAVERLSANPLADSIRSVSAPAQHPYRVFRIGGDLPAMYYYNCVIDVTRPTTIHKMNSMTGDRILPFIMEPDEVIDIDSPRDLAIARMLMEGVN